MAPGEGSSDEGADVSSGSSGGETPDAPTNARNSLDPSVDGVWLRRRRPPDRPGVPRISTVVLLVAFFGILALYIALGHGR
ncbi:hypothetical protein OHA40_23515 [Nocardia sp. NBC_00508]|uniref:hypothetical protein n=1 Tax=Nocardia sp. NBC_00508 TaxID=2975992 RepID=UPI002E81BB1F|nr:hypothetical protein [Nocardia sp. NBC_00508]WUD64637.1 hypothetical protein OHA40_23515 [Nocardia sp. NBC_00508]